jgi:hypothetical protein
MHYPRAQRTLLPMANGAAMALLAIELSAVAALAFHGVARIVALLVAINGAAIIVVIAALAISGVATGLRRRGRR